MRFLLLAVFVASGFSGLIYESIWTHYLKLFLGHAAYAQALVLAMFMGGMALGALGAARISQKIRNPLRAYAWVEGAVGLLALLFHPVFIAATSRLFEVWLPALGDPGTAATAKWCLGAALILPQSVLLGATFPLMSAGLIRMRPAKPGGAVALLYFGNSLGGALGVLASGFFLIGWLGLPGTIMLAGGINLILAALVAWFAPQATPRTEQAPPAPAPAEQTAAGLSRILILTAALTGLASFAYEIGWIRMLSLVLGSSTHAFEVMLAAFILGLALGGLMVRPVIDWIKSPVGLLGFAQTAMGLSAVATLPVYGMSFDIMRELVLSLPKTDEGYQLFNLASSGIAAAVMLPATIFAGATLPLITAALYRLGRKESAIGIVYGANTVGAIAGVVLAVHLGLPLLGLKGLIAAGAALDIALGVLLLAWVHRPAYLRIKPMAALVLGGGGLTAALMFAQLDAHKMASGVYRSGRLLAPGASDILDHRDGKTATVDLAGKRGGFVSIRTNGKADASIEMGPGSEPSWDEATMIVAGALPAFLRQDATLAANIGFGSGLTSHTLLLPHLLKQVDTIEIERMMVDVAQGFRPHNEMVYTDSRSRIFIDDAKSYFSTHASHYDVIVAEPSNPWVSGVAGLFSTEFYKLVRRHLNDKGVLVQWIQMYEIDLSLVASILKALDANFPDWAVYSATRDDLLIVAAKDGPVPPVDASVLILPPFARDLGRIAIRGEQDVAYRRLGGKALFKPWLDRHPIPANSDYYPVVDQNAARTRFLKRNARQMLEPSSHVLPVIEWVEGVTPAWNHTRVTASEYLPVAYRIVAAQNLRDALAAGVPGQIPTETELSDLPRDVSSEVRALLSRCAQPETGNELSALFSIAKRIVPHLRPMELEALWPHLAAWPCGRNLTESGKQWLALFQAAGARNGKRAAEKAEALLNAGGQEGERLTYLLTAALAGRLAEKDWDKARALTKRPDFDHGDFTLGLLAARADLGG